MCKTAMSVDVSSRRKDTALDCVSAVENKMLIIMTLLGEKN